MKKSADRRPLLDKPPDPNTPPPNAPAAAAHEATRRAKPSYKALGLLLLCLVALTIGALVFLARSENPDSATANARRLAVSRQEQRFLREQEDTDEPPEMADGGAIDNGKGVKSVEESIKAEYAPVKPHGSGGTGSR